MASDLSVAEETSTIKMLDYIPIGEESDNPWLDRIGQLREFTDDSPTDGDEESASDGDTGSAASVEQEGDTRMVVKGAGGHDESTASQGMVVAMEALELPVNSGPPVAPNMTMASPSNPGASGSPAIHTEAL